MRKKILILGYVRQNLGDDLFISMLLNRYKNIDFINYVINNDFAIPFKMYKNFKPLISKNLPMMEYDLSNYDCCIYIGGSLFRENDKAIDQKKNILKFIKKCKENNLKFYYVSSNFGPYKTNEFYKLCEEIFNSIDSICFRDKFSYEQFKDIKSTKYAPDLVFSLDFNKINSKQKIKNSIGISVIDLNAPGREKEVIDCAEKYHKMLMNNIRKFIDEGKTVYLFCFCKHEKDNIEINRILESLSNKYIKRIKVVNYFGKEGQLYDFLKKYSKIEKMICTRFHSLVLSLLFKQDLISISYSHKSTNLLNDIDCDFKNIVIDKNIDKLIIKDSWFKRISDKDLSILTENSISQLEEIDNQLKNENWTKHIKIKRLGILKRGKRKLRSIKKRIYK